MLQEILKTAEILQLFLGSFGNMDSDRLLYPTAFNTADGTCDHHQFIQLIGSCLHHQFIELIGSCVYHQFIQLMAPVSTISYRANRHLWLSSVYRDNRLLCPSSVYRAYKHLCPSSIIELIGSCVHHQFIQLMAPVSIISL